MINYFEKIQQDNIFLFMKLKSEINDICLQYRKELVALNSNDNYENIIITEINNSNFLKDKYNFEYRFNRGQLVVLNSEPTSDFSMYQICFNLNFKQHDKLNDLVLNAEVSSISFRKEVSPEFNVEYEFDKESIQISGSSDENYFYSGFSFFYDETALFSSPFLDGYISGESEFTLEEESYSNYMNGLAIMAKNDFEKVKSLLLEKEPISKEDIDIFQITYDIDISSTPYDVSHNFNEPVIIEKKNVNQIKNRMNI